MKLEELQKVYSTKTYVMMIIVCLATLKLGVYVLVALVPLMLASFMESEEINYKNRNEKQREF